MRLQSRTICVTAALVALPPLSLAAGSPTPAGAEADQYEGELKDAWLDGRIETAYALNEHLNPLSIDTRVEDGVVTLEGSVASDADRELAVEIASNLDGVSKVENRLTVDTSAPMTEATGRKTRDFLETVDDATTTAAVKSRLVENSKTRAMNIDVDTDAGVVTLSGTVGSEKERELAEALARQTRNVWRVHNNLVVESS